MSETSTPAGRLRVVGKVHGALNAIIEWAGDSEDWEFKQFISQEQLDSFATENNLLIVMESEK